MVEYQVTEVIFKILFFKIMLAIEPKNARIPCLLDFRVEVPLRKVIAVTEACCSTLINT